MQYPWGNNRRFHSLADQNKQRYGSRIQKVSVDAGFTCPNRDGTKGTGGCTFCNNKGFSPSYCHEEPSIINQINGGLTFLKNRYKKAEIFVAYFQAYSNTYASLQVLKDRYEEALSHPGISGISIGTRPDCMSGEILDYLTGLSKEYIIQIEYGVESCYEETLKRINRGHTFADSVKAIRETTNRGLQTGIHLIIGLPGEDREQILDQSKIISRLPIHSVKLHQLQIVKNTAIAEEYLEYPEHFDLFSAQEYVVLMADFLEYLNPAIAIERFAGEVPPKYNMRKLWDGMRSDQIIGLIENELEKRNSWQGKKCTQ